MNLPQGVAGTVVTATGFGSWLIANDIYLKFGLLVLTALAAVTTVLLNIKKYRSKD